MSKRPLTFINETGDRVKDRKTQELRHSRIRAHAAKASHEARRFGDRQRPRPGPTVPVVLAPAHQAQNENEEDVVNALTTHNHFASPYPLFGNYRSELYDSLAVKDSAQIMEIVDVYIQSLMPIDDLPLRVFDVPSIYAIGRFAMTGDTGLLFAIVAGFKHSIDHLRDRRQARSSPSAVVLASRSIALNMLARRLNEPSPHLNDEFMQTVALLAWQARHTGDELSYKLHWRGYNRLVDARAVANPSPKALTHASVDLAVLDSTTAIESGRSMFAHARAPYVKPQPAINPSPEDPPDIAALPRGFRILARYRLISDSTITVFARAAHVFNSLHSNPDVLAADPQRSWRYKDYLEACPCLGSKETSLDKMLCLALIVYCFTGFAKARHLAYSFAGPRQVLTKEMGNWPVTDLEYWDGSSGVKMMLKTAVADCMLWISLVTVDSWRESEELTPSSETLLETLRKTLGQEKRYLVWDDVEGIVKDFFWYEGMLLWWRFQWPRLIRQSIP